MSQERSTDSHACRSHRGRESWSSCRRAALVCYPTGQTHRVTPVTCGERLVVVSWVQSHVRDGAAREILRDLALALDALPAADVAGAARDRVNKAHINLLRRWSEA